MPHALLRRSLFPLLLRRIRVVGLEHVPTSGPFLMVANHQSYLDPVELFLPLAVRRDLKPWFLTTEHVWKSFSRLGGRGLLRWLGMIPIVNAHKAESLGPARAVLEAGGIVGIFPEGGRNRRQTNPDSATVMLRGKTGAARLAIATGVPAVPAGIIAPDGATTFEAIRNFIRPRQRMEVRFGPALRFARNTGELTREQLDDATRSMMQAVGSLCGKRYPY